MLQLLPEFTSIDTSASPGVCYRCNGAKQPGDEGVLNLGFTIDFEGVPELCQSCCMEIGSHFPAAGRLKEKLSDCHKARRQDGMEKRRFEATIAAREARIVELEA